MQRSFSSLLINFVQVFIYHLSSPRVDQKLSGQNGGYSLAQAQAIVSEIKELQSSMSYGEQERQNLMQVKQSCRSWGEGCWGDVVLECDTGSSDRQ